MAKRPALPKSELEVARIVWSLGRATVREVLASLPEGRRLDFKTVQTYLRRLEAKGYLGVRREGRGNVYTPAVQHRTVVREVVDDFVNRLFDGRAVPLVQHLIEDQRLTDEEIDQLQATLDRLKERRP
jgi:BlaI family transcriptional regulator, penicillinase repressor